MIWSAGDLGVEIDFGRNEPGAILQRKELEGWQDYWQNGRLVNNPHNIAAQAKDAGLLR